jgi:TPR repeat protein
MNLRRIAIGVGVVSVLCSGPAWAGAAGEAAFRAGDYAAAASDFLEEAQMGVAKAQSHLGALYVGGLGVPRDDAKAFEWFKKAAEQGYPNAQYSVGYMYLEGRGVPRDYGKALEWLQKAARQGQGDAQSRLALMYERGTGVSKDYVKAYAWYNVSAANLDDLGTATHREILESRMGAADVAKAQKLSQEYFDKYVAPFRAVD